MPEVHPTAILEGDIRLAEEVFIGPNCVLTGPIAIGAGSRLIGNVYLRGPLIMGEGNVVYPFACLGFAPQHMKFDPDTPGKGLLIGNNNTFREHVTVHRAFTDDGPTRIGDRNCFMAVSHVGHDCRIGDDNTFANGVLIAGHAEIDRNIFFGGNSVVHQFVRVGRGAMFAGLVGTNKDVPPYFMVTGVQIIGSLNIVGLRRSGLPTDAIDDARWVFKVLYRMNLSPQASLNALQERADRPMVKEYLDFIQSSSRGITPGRGKAARGTA